MIEGDGGVFEAEEELDTGVELGVVELIFGAEDRLDLDFEAYGLWLLK